MGALEEELGALVPVGGRQDDGRRTPRRRAPREDLQRCRRASASFRHDLTRSLRRRRLTPEATAGA